MRNFIDKEDVNANFGEPRLIVDGKKIPSVWFALSDIPGARPSTDYAQKAIAQFSDCGINVVCGDCNLQSGWKEDGSVDVRDFLKETEGILRANANAYIVMRLHVNPPYWWMRKNPDELIRYYGMENTDSGDYGDRLIAMDRKPNEMRASYASKKFLSDCSKVITAYLKAVKQAGVDRLLGVQVAYGTCGEWHWWGSNYIDERSVDYGKAMLEYFRDFVREKYKTVERLKEAYGTDENFDNVRFATPSERHEKNDLGLRSARAVDALICLQRSRTDAIATLCKAVKAADENLLAGSFYGYFFGAGDAMFEQGRLFEDENVDFIAATAPYGKNKQCGNFHNYRHLAESMRLNGMLYLNEMDQGYKAHSVYRDETPIYECESEEEYRAVLKRNIMENILRGNGAWYYDHRLRTDSIYEKAGYWDKEERLQTISELQRVCKNLIEKKYVKTTDVLIVFDGKSRYYFADSFLKNSYDAFDCLDAIMKSGAGVDFIALDDIEKCDVSRYKCVVFMECLAMGNKTYDYLQNVVKDGNRKIVLVGRCGLVVDGAVSEERASKLKNGCECLEKPSIDSKYYRTLFKEAGAWIYTENGEVVVADNETVMVHTKGVPVTRLNLPSGEIEIENGKYNTVVYNVITGERVL